MKTEDWEEFRSLVPCADTDELFHCRDGNVCRVHRLIKRIEDENNESAGLLLMALQIINRFRPKKGEDVRWLRKWVDGTNDFLLRRTK